MSGEDEVPLGDTRYLRQIAERILSHRTPGPLDSIRLKREYELKKRHDPEDSNAHETRR